MVPFQVDPSWYERYWWREQTRSRRSATLRTHVLGAAENTGRFIMASLEFLGYVLFLIVSSDFRLPRCDDALAKPRHHHEMSRDHHESLRG